jgi:hypothetical protein
MAHISLRLGVARFRIESRDQEILGTLSRIFCEPPEAAQQDDLGTKLHSYGIADVSSGTASPGYVIHIDGGGKLACPDKSWAIHITASLVSNWLIAALTQRSNTFHAAAFSRSGCGVLVPGLSQSGKSTTAAIFALAGFQHYTDDIAILDNNLRLLPFPRAIVLRNGGWERLKESFPDAAEEHLIWGSDVTSSWYVDPFLPGSPVNADQLPQIGLILLPIREPHAPTLAHLARSEVVPTLISECFAMAERPSNAIESVVSLARNADCYRINMARPLEAVEAVNRLIDG